MTKYLLKALNDFFQSIGLNYSYQMYNTDSPIYPYWIGSYIEQESLTEDGNVNFTFTLNAFDRGGTWSRIEESKEKLRQATIDGVWLNEGGMYFNVLYGGTTTIQEEDHELKRLVVTLDIKTYRKGMK